MQENTNQTKNNVNVHETDIEIAFGKFARTYFDRFEEFCKPVLANLASAEY